MSKDTDFPAFPIHGTCHAYQFTGLTARDYFAAKALQGMLADSEVKGSEDEFAERSYKMADAMLKAREA